MGNSLRPDTKLEIILAQNCRCAYCNRPLLGLVLNWDHIIPYAYSRSFADGNAAASCRECNMKKHSKVMDEDGFMSFIIERMTWSGDIGEEAPEGHEDYWRREFHQKSTKPDTGNMRA